MWFVDDCSQFCDCCSFICHVGLRLLTVDECWWFWYYFGGFVLGFEIWVVYLVFEFCFSVLLLVVWFSCCVFVLSLLGCLVSWFIVWRFGCWLLIWLLGLIVVLSDCLFGFVFVRVCTLSSDLLELYVTCWLLIVSCRRLWWLLLVGIVVWYFG